MHLAARLSKPLAIVALVALLAACAGAPGLTPGSTPGSTQTPGLAGRAFLSVSATDAGVDRPLVPGTRIRLDLRATDLTASAGCNTMGGSYHLDGGRLIVDQLATTDMGCSAALGAQDAWLSTLLMAQPVLTLNGNDLTLDGGSTVIKFLDRVVAQPDKPLAGPLWTVDSIISGDVVSSVPNGAIGSILFNADGTLTVFTGCNQGSASWSQVGNTVQVSDLVLTKKACPGSGATLEDAIVGVLRAGTIGVTIDADSLTLQAGASGVQLRTS